MRILVFLAFFISISPCAMADRYLYAMKAPEQEEILVQGAPILASEQEHSVLMYQTCKGVKRGRGNFYFILTNGGGDSFNFYASNLRVSDQCGRPVRVVPKRELIADKRGEKNRKSFLSDLLYIFDLFAADDAGTVECESHSVSKLRKHRKSCWVDESVCKTEVTSSKSTLYCDALRRQALRQADEDEARREGAIKGNYEQWKYKLSNFYLDSNTIFPHSDYAANFQIEVPKKIEKELEYLVFTYDVGDETHSFRYDCPKHRR